MSKITLIILEYKKHPFYGYRKISQGLKEYDITPKIVRRLMKKIGIKAIYPGPKTSISNKEHKKYPYLLRDKLILAPNHVWATDITYIKLNGANVYLTAVVDLYSRKVLSWNLSNTMDASFCVETSESANKKVWYSCHF